MEKVLWKKLSTVEVSQKWALTTYFIIRKAKSQKLGRNFSFINTSKYDWISLLITCQQRWQLKEANDINNLVYAKLNKKFWHIPYSKDIFICEKKGQNS